MQTPVIEARNISKTFEGPVPVKVLTDINLVVEKGEFVSLMGKSGCGKSTLLYILSTMDTDYSGELLIEGVSMAGKNDKALAHVRNEKIGFVFQFHYLLDEFSILKNVMLPGLKLGKYKADEIAHRAMEKLAILGIDGLAHKMPTQLSGGEKQRVAIARALINDPGIIMADEPTGSLDKKNSDIVFDLFNKLSRELGQTILIVTHDAGFAQRTKRIVHLEDGRIVNHV